MSALDGSDVSQRHLPKEGDAARLTSVAVQPDKTSWLLTSAFPPKAEKRRKVKSTKESLREHALTCQRLTALTAVSVTFRRKVTRPDCRQLPSSLTKRHAFGRQPFRRKRKGGQRPKA